MGLATIWIGLVSLFNEDTPWHRKLNSNNSYGILTFPHQRSTVLL